MKATRVEAWLEDFTGSVEDLSVQCLTGMPLESCIRRDDGTDHISWLFTEEVPAATMRVIVRLSEICRDTPARLVSIDSTEVDR